MVVAHFMLKAKIEIVKREIDSLKNKEFNLSELLKLSGTIDKLIKIVKNESIPD